jgi:hypothetical protein
MSENTEVIQGDFHNMPFPDNSFDAVFSVEATCHASEVSILPLSKYLLVCCSLCFGYWSEMPFGAVECIDRCIHCSGML